MPQFVTGVVGAEVPVVAIDGGAGGTRPVGANIVGGARVEVVARCAVWKIAATGVGGAAIICTRVVIVAIQQRIGNAGAAIAVVPQGACVAVIAIGYIGDEKATAFR